MPLLSTEKKVRPLAVWLVRREGEPLAERIQTSLPEVKVFYPEAGLLCAKERFRACFADYDWVLVMSTGIAVRYIDGLLVDKHQDPAVVVLDEGGHHAIALLSGHEGGANRLAYLVAQITGAAPVVTTATESRKPLVLGVGCRKGTTLECLEEAVRKVLPEKDFSLIREVVTVDLKAEEPGLVEFCRKHDLPLRWFSREALAARAWATKPSAWVQENLGVDGVCEICALMASPTGKLLVEKTTFQGTAIALVEDKFN